MLPNMSRTHIAWLGFPASEAASFGLGYGGRVVAVLLAAAAGGVRCGVRGAGHGVSGHSVG